jgi:hypothetical protein
MLAEGHQLTPPSPSSFVLDSFEEAHRMHLRRISYFGMAVGLALVLVSLIWSVELLYPSHLVPYVLLPAIIGAAGIFVFVPGVSATRAGPIRLEIGAAGIRFRWARGTQETFTWDSQRLKFKLYDFRGFSSPVASTEPCVIAFGLYPGKQYALSPDALDATISEATARGLKVILANQSSHRGVMRILTISAAT